MCIRLLAAVAAGDLIVPAITFKTNSNENKCLLLIQVYNIHGCVDGG